MQNSETCYILPSGSWEEYLDFIVFRTVDGAHSPFPILILSLKKPSSIVVVILATFWFLWLENYLGTMQKTYIFQVLEVIQLEQRELLAPVTD